MVKNVEQFTDTNFMAPADLKRIARSLQRASLFKRYSHGTIKRSTMAMINYYMRIAGEGFSKHPRNLHVTM